jgi:universal stress protein A
METLKHIIVGVDFSARSHGAAVMAVELARLADADVELVHVIEARPTDKDAGVLGLTLSRLERLLHDEAQKDLENMAKELGYGKVHTAVVSGSAATELTRRSTERSADLLVVGNVGPHSARMRKALGVTAYRLVESGPAEVFVVKPYQHKVPQNMAAAIDLQKPSEKVLKTALEVSTLTGANLYAVHVYLDWLERRMLRSVSDSAIDRFSLQMEDENYGRVAAFVKEHVPEDAQVIPVAVSGSPTEALIRFLQMRYIDMVVLGTGTSPRLAGFPIGSITHSVVNQTASSVLVVRS